MKNKLQRFMILVIALTVVSLMLVSGTYAKYTTSATGSDTATVAKWSIILGTDTEIAVTPSNNLAFNLFDTILDTATDAAETDVASGKIIAPGTYGKFNLDIKNASEVNAKYSVTLALTNASSIPIEFSTDKSTWTSDLTSFNQAEKNIAMGVKDTIEVYWRWAYERGGDAATITTNDATDTGFGITARTSAPTVKVQATINVTQVD